jgi:hypothetical protein
MCASVQTRVYLKFIVFLLYSAVNLIVSAGVREIGYLDSNRTASCMQNEKLKNNVYWFPKSEVILGTIGLPQNVAYVRR